MDNKVLSDSLNKTLNIARGERDAVTRHMIELEQEVCRLKSRLAAYEDTGLEPEEIERIVDAYGRGHTLRTESAERLEIVREIKTDRLRELAKAEKDGRLEVLPCKVGDHILADGREAIVVWFFGYKTGRYLHAQFLDNAECADIPFYEIGKNRLSARDEAEAALKGGDAEGTERKLSRFCGRRA